MLHGLTLGNILPDHARCWHVLAGQHTIFPVQEQVKVDCLLAYSCPTMTMWTGLHGPNMMAFAVTILS